MLTFLVLCATTVSKPTAWIDGPIKGKNFLAYVEQVLVSALKPGDIVLIGNLGSTKGNAMRPAIRAAGAKLFFLPPHSPGCAEHRTFCFSSGAAFPWTQQLP